MADFTYTADNVLEEEIKYSTYISESENGYEQRRSKLANPLRLFTLNFNNRTATEKNNILNFFIGKKGSFGAFTWVNPNDSTTYTVRHNSDSLKIKRVAFNIFSFSLEFMEVRS